MCALARIHDGLASFPQVAPYVHPRWILAAHVKQPVPYMRLKGAASAEALPADAGDLRNLPVQAVGPAGAAAPESDDEAGVPDNAASLGQGDDDDPANDYPEALRPSQRIVRGKTHSSVSAYNYANAAFRHLAAV